MYRPLPLLSFVFLAHAAVAQTPEPATATPTVPAKWDVSAKHGPSRDIEFVTTTGTWMSLDVSPDGRSEEHTSELQSRLHLVCRLLLEKKKKRTIHTL